MSWPWTGEADRLARDIVAFIDAACAGEPPDFDALALRIHRWQRANDPVLDAISDGVARRVTEIPAVPVALFKDLAVGTVPPLGAPVTFLTSGTTGGGRGAHRMRSAALYEHGALRWAQRCVPHMPTRCVNLLVDPAEHPESSLSHMVALFASHDPKGSATWHLGPDGVDPTAFVRALHDLDEPVFVGSTAFALAEVLPHAPALPAGSVLMVTGGFKGRAHAISDAELYRAAAERMAPDRVVTEYGMTELSSQLWGIPGGAYRPPPWLRAIAVDPTTEREMPSGEPGQLRFYDLCNLDCTLGVETMDEGVVHADGSVTLVGRLTDAPARGCSLTVEEAWLARTRT